MKTNRSELGVRGLRGALEVRRRAAIRRGDPICVFDLAEKLNVEVRFGGGSSFGGIYSRSSQAIVVPSMRPPGRQASTCAHELAHWFFNHGSRIDDLTEDPRLTDQSPEERLASLFANYLLMPPWAVEMAYSARHWRIDQSTPVQSFIVAGQLGVGYETLVYHLWLSMNAITRSHATKLMKVTPKAIRASILGTECSSHLIVADESWNAVAVDLRVGDLAIVPTDGVIEGSSVSSTEINAVGQVVKAQHPGISRVVAGRGTWSSFVRVRRKEFEGRSIYRHLEDPDVYTCT